MKNLQDRTKQFALDVFKFCGCLPDDPAYRVIRYQLLKAASSVGANYRAACRAQSRRAFIAKLSIVEEEADESVFWLEMLEGLGFQENKTLQRLKDEANQLVSIVVASKKTARRDS